jgi:O-succinylbenzoate synthase
MEIEDRRAFLYWAGLLKFHLQFRRYRLPFLSPVRTAHGPWAEREGLLVRLESADRRVGWGDAAPVPPYSRESVDKAEAACRALGSMVDHESLVAAPAPSLVAALRAAESDMLWDRQPEATDDSRFLPVSALLPAGAAGIKALRRIAGSDFRTFKWKVGVYDPADELALLDDVCAELPPGGRLRLDANGAWDRRNAERWMGRCADYPVEFVEQPAGRGADDLLRGLAADFPTPVALDESIASDGEIDRWLSSGWPGIFVVKPSLLEDAGGVLARLGAAGASVVFSSALETAIGARAALRAAFDWKGESRAIGFGVWPLFSDPAFDGPAARPFFTRADGERLNPQNLWNALN